jgi:hypothetical protein
MKTQLRNFKEVMPKDDFCGLCGLLNSRCLCEKYKCKCDIYAIECEWPMCTCEKCLELNPMCECREENDQ